MRPVLPVLALAALVALPASAAGHHHAAKSAAAPPDAAVTGVAASSALATPYDYGTDATSAKAGAMTTTTSTGKHKAAKPRAADLDPIGVSPDGAARKHAKVQPLPAY